MSNEAVKQYSAILDHFIARLKERYGVTITEQEYLEAIKKFKQTYAKSSNKKIGYVYIKSIKVWVLYRKDDKLFLTAYPNNIETSWEGLIISCFPRANRKLATCLFNLYQEECKVIPRFETIKEHAIYCFKNTIFPTVHMHKYVKKEFRFKLMAKIKEVIQCKSPFLKLQPVRIKQYKPLIEKQKEKKQKVSFDHQL